jgi:hypothetical protein
VAITSIHDLTAFQRRVPVHATVSDLEGADRPAASGQQTLGRLFEIVIYLERFNATKSNTDLQLASANRANDRNGLRSVDCGVDA